MGDKLFLDYSGKTIDIIDAQTGEIHHDQIFVASMSPSSYTYAEATWTQNFADWTATVSRALSYFGGVPRLRVPDDEVTPDAIVRLVKDRGVAKLPANDRRLAEGWSSDHIRSQGEEVFSQVFGGI